MLIELGQLVAFLAFAWAVGKVQVDVNSRHDARLDEIEKQQAVLIRDQKYLIEMVADKMDLFQQQFNLMKQQLTSCLTKGKE